MSAAHLIKHTPASAASTATDQNAQITFPVGPQGREQIRVLGGQTNHCMAHTKHSGTWEGGPGTGSLNPCPPASPGNSEEDDGGGGTRVKKKRKKKDKKDSASWQKTSERESASKPKKKKELKELKEILPRKSKAPKEPKELKEAKESKKFKVLKSPKEPKKGRKGREAKAKPTVDCKTTSSPPRQRGRKPK